MVFVLQRIEELELRDIASAMRLSLATVKRRLAHAEDRLAVLVARDPILKTYLQTHKKKGREHDDAS
jgi:DNA-directed RNA polymerase specialized sigma24 family protein